LTQKSSDSISSGGFLDLELLDRNRNGRIRKFCTNLHVLGDPLDALC
jgi:hypothetical protein